MTTIIALPLKGEIYSDSRVTYGNHEIYGNNYKKVFKHPDGKLIAAGCGDVTLIATELTRLGFNSQEFHKDAWSSTMISNGADILLLNSYLNNAAIINLKSDKKGKVTSRTLEVTTGNTRLVAGSGVRPCYKVYDKTKDVKKALRYAAFCDKGTDFNVQKEAL